MKNWKVKFLEKALLGHGTDINNKEMIIDKCLALAYKDTLTAGRFYASSFKYNGKDICNLTNKILLENEFVFSVDLIEKVAKLFNDKDLIVVKDRYISCFGLSQKLVNMTFKYMYIFDDYISDDNLKLDFSNCHCPLDSIILKSINYKECVWSKLDKDKYLYCQKTISNELIKKQLDQELCSMGNLAYDFIQW